MKQKDNNANLSNKQAKNDEIKNLSGYPFYPTDEDIYSKWKEEKNINPEDISKNKEPIKNEKLGAKNEKDFKDDVSGSDLDVPGSEPDEQQENSGSEDEENNYYSLGGDGHNNLDEDKG